MKKALLNSFCLPQISKKLLTFLLIAIFSIAGIYKTFAQANSYAYSVNQSAGLYTNLTAGSIAQLGASPYNTAVGTNDQVALNVPLGFIFSFSGTPYSTVNVSSNGFITFGATAPLANEYNPISGTGGYSAAIAAYGRDLRNNNIATFYTTTGVAPNRVFTIQYNSDRNTTGNVQAQIKLYETSNVIEIIHRTRAAGDYTTGIGALTGQIGLRGANNNDVNNLNITCNNAGPSNNWTTTTLASSNIDPNNRAYSCKTRGGTTSSCLPATDIKFTWTPVTCFAPSSVIAPLATLLQTSAVVSWTPPATLPGVGYEVYYTTSAVLPNAATVANGGTPAVGTNTVTISSGLTPNTLYYLYVRSNCGAGDKSSWSPQYTFKTLCNGVAVPYLENFNATVVPSIPSCTYKQDFIVVPGEGIAPNYNNTWVSKAAFAPDGFPTQHMTCLSTTSGTTNAYFYSAGVNLTAGTSYKLSYKYGAALAFLGKVQSLTVSYATAPTNTAIVAQLAQHLSTKSSPLTNTVNFIPAVSGVYYMVFYDSSAALQQSTLLDDIVVEVSTCFPPTALNAGNVSANSETLSWTAPASVPANGYEYYISTSATPPTNNTIISGVSSGNFITISGLTGSTTYYYWVRSSCGGGDKSLWSSTFGTFTTDPPVVSQIYCGGVNPVSANTSDYINNFLTNGCITNISNLATGYSLPTGYGNYKPLIATQVAGGTVNFSVTFASFGTAGVAIWVDWNHNAVFDTTEKMFSTVNYTAAGTLTNSFIVPLGATLGNTTMRVMVDYWQANPTNPCAFGTTGATRGEVEDYTFNVKVAPPAITLSGTSTTICAGDTTALVTITSLLSNYTNYSWFPAAFSGTPATGYTFNPTSTTTYTLTGLNTSTFQTTTVKYVVNVNIPPTPIVVTPSSATVCQGQTPVSLVATGAVVSGIIAGGTVIFSEDFQDPSLLGWSIVNNGVAGPLALATWHQESSPYVYNTYPVFNSNDFTRFFMTNADSQGSGNLNDNVLTSPLIVIPNTYSNCNISYYQFLQGFNAGTFRAAVEVQVGGVGPWTPIYLKTTTIAVGAASAFENVILDLSANIGQTIQIRFNHRDTWGFFWAIDNLVITGNPPNVKWNTQVAPVAIGSAVPGLYTAYSTSTINTPYIAGAGAFTVLALPNATTTFTASATSGSGCSVQTLVPITVDSLTLGTFTSGTGQSYCGDATPLDITISGNNGTIVKWQSSTTPTFTTFTDIATTSNTLTSALMGVISTSTYYRAVIQVNACTFNSPAVLVIVLSTTWNGSAWSNGLPDISTKAIFNGNYTSAAGVAGDLEACSVQVLSGSVNFLGGATLIVENEVKVTAGTLTFQDTANLLQNNDSAVNTGDIIYIRKSKGMKLYDYTYWSTPVTKPTMTLLSLSPFTQFDKCFFWDTTLPTWYWTIAPQSTEMIKGVGYIVRSPQTYNNTNQIFTGIFTGVPNNGIITTPIKRNGPGNNELNLVGNPYPSDLFADALIGINASFPNFSKIDGTLYFWTHNTPITALNYTSNDYAAYNLSGGVGTLPAINSGVNNAAPNGYIASGQAFFVTSLVANDVLTFNNSMRQPGNTSIFYKGATPAITEKHRVWLEMTNDQGAYSQSLIAYVDGATAAKDRNYDSVIFDETTSINLYSVLNTDKFTIKGVGLPFNVLDTHQLGYISNVAETFQIKLNNFDGLFLSQDVYLEDKELNIFTNLKLADYSFATQVGTFENRFVLHFTPPTLSNNANILNDNNLSIIKKNNDIVLKSFQSTMKSIAIFDVSGRKIYNNKNVNNNNFVISNLNSSQQVIIVQVTSAEGLVTSKKIVF